MTEPETPAVASILAPAGSPAAGHLTQTRDLAHRLAGARVALDEAKEATAAAQAVYDDLERQLFEGLENAGVRSIVTELGRFTLNDLAWATVEDAAAARDWAAHVAPELLVLNHQSLSKIVRDTLKGEGEFTELPPGVTFKTSRKITWRRSA